MDDTDLPSYDGAVAADSFIFPSAPPLDIEEDTDANQPLFKELTEEEIRKACYDYAKTKFGNVSSAIKHMVFTNIQRSYSLHYKLETFCEKREVIAGYSHYYKQNIDGPKNGPEPDLWSIKVDCPSTPKDYEEPNIVPHTEQVKTCHQCDGRAKEDCLICEGAGWTYCESCSGDGCSVCTSGRLNCMPCNKTGRIKCRTCDGYKKLKHYKELKVTWKTYTDHFESNPSNVPPELLQSSTCKEIFHEELPVLHPLKDFPDASLKLASFQLIQKHQNLQKKIRDEVVRMQRHSIRAVPITTVKYQYKEKEGELYVYGIENSVYFETFPLKSNCCIS